ncbi:MAG: hypothetical protein DCF22_05445 [Leptolyngbya sp.]|nr:MAG: hypothetical protein DCF22_05445 [Leptolyngbya sp.]
MTVSKTGQSAIFSKESKVDWKKISQGFEDIVARYPDAWNLANYARFACLAEDKAKSKALLNQSLMDKLASGLVDELPEAYPSINFSACYGFSRDPD